jgi:PleD family two-component response regulator
MVKHKLPEQVVLYRSEHPSQKKLRIILNDLGIVFHEIQYLAELKDLSVIEKSPCVLAIIDGEMKGIEFLRSVMHYHPWTQRMLITNSGDIRFLEQAINKAHINYLLSLPLSEETLKVYLMKANKRFQNLIRPINKLDVLSSVTSDLLQENERMRLAASTDALTKLPNRRSMNLVMENLWHQYVTANVVFSFAMLDIDHFKNVNDRYGHEAGDRV